MSTDKTIAPVAVNEALETIFKLEEFNFRFKKDKLGNQRPGVKLMAPVPTLKGVISILESGDVKQFELMRDSFYDVVRSVLTEMVTNNLELSQENLELPKLSWAAIANMPKEDRRSSSLPEELWTAFVEDYCAVMPSRTGKSPEAVKNATEVYVRKFAPWKTQKDVIKRLKEQLAIYTETANASNFSDILELLVRRADSYLAADDLLTIGQNL